MKHLFTILFLASLALAQYQQTGNYSSTGLSATGAVTVPSTPKITTASLPSGTQNVLYGSTLTEAGGTAPFCWTITSGSLPSGLSLNGGTLTTGPSGSCAVGGTGLISGTPSVTGSFALSFLLTDGTGLTDAASFSLTVNGTVTITTASMASGTVGIGYAQVFNAAGGNLPYTWSMTSGAAALSAIGLTFNAGTATLSGTPDAGSAGSYSLTIQVNDSATPTPHSDSRSYVLVIAPTSGLAIAQLPQIWVNSHMADPPGGVYDVEKTLCHSGCDYTDSLSDLNKSTTDWCSAADQWRRVKVTHGTVITGAMGSGSASQWTWCSKAVGGGKPTKFLVYESDTPLPAGQTVCSHKTVDNADGSSPRNLGCTNDIASMWSLHSVTGNPSGAVNTQGAIINMAAPNGNGDGPSHIVVRDMEATSCAGWSATTQANGVCVLTANLYSQIFLESPSSVTVPTKQNQPHEIGFERDYIHGDYGDDGLSASGAQNNVQIKVGCGDCWFMWNYFDRSSEGGGNVSLTLAGQSKPTIHNLGGESHVIALADALEGIKLVGNWFEGGSIPTFSGGSQNQNVHDHIPSDVEYRKNRMTHAPAWLTLSCAAPTNVGIKNSSELKIGIRYLFNGNIVENSNGCGQNGEVFLLAVRACSGGATNPCDNYQAVTRDITMTNDIFRHAGNGFSTSARSGGSTAGISTSLPARNWFISNNLLYDIGNTVAHPGTAPGRLVFMGAAGSSWTCTGSRNYDGAHPNIVQMTCTDGGTGQHQTDINIGDPVLVQTCTDTSFNTPTVGTVPTLGPPALSPTDPSTLVVYYSNSGGTATTTGCTLSNSQGAPFNMIFTHNTAIMDESLVTGTTLQFPSGSSSRTNPDYYVNNTWRDNLFAVNPASSWGGWKLSAATEGLQSEQQWDVGSFTVDHMTVFRPASVASTYRQFGPSCPAPTGCTPTGAIYPAADPGTTFWFVQNVVCPGATVGASDCPGFAGLMSGVAMNNNSLHPLTDYALVADSPYKAGGARQAFDGTSLGADMSKISTAQTETKYSGCSSTPTAANYCGPTGPYTD